MSTTTREYIKGAGFIIISIGTLGLLLNEFVFGASQIRTIIFAVLNVIGLLCLLYGRFWTGDKAAS